MDSAPPRENVLLNRNVGWYVLAFGWLLAAAGIFLPTWYDENYSYWMFITRGPAIILADYHLPNNHIAYNLLRWAWVSVFGDGLLGQRLLSVGFTGAAGAGVLVAARTLGGRSAGVAGLFFFCTSHTVVVLAGQARGYAVTFALVAWAFVSLVRWVTEERRRMPWGYVFLGGLALGVSPGNVFTLAAIASWAMLSTVRGKSFTAARWQWLVRAPWLVAPLGFGAVFYLGKGGDLRRVAEIGAAETSNVLSTFLGIFVYDAWALPLLLLAALCSRSSALGSKDACLIVGLVAIVMTAGLTIANPPGRVFAPMLVLLACSQGLWLADLTLTWRGWSQPAALVFAVVLAAVVRETLLRETVALRVEPETRVQTLTDQYYRDSTYRPREMIAALKQTSRDSLIVVDHRTVWDLAGFFQDAASVRHTCVTNGVKKFRCRFIDSDFSNSVAHLVVVHWKMSGLEEMAEAAGKLLKVRLGAAKRLHGVRDGFYLARVYELKELISSTPSK